MTGTGAPLCVLRLDIEGGHGGSSRSLHESLRHIDRGRVKPEVWCRRAGPIEGRYAVLDIPCRVQPALPRLSTVRRFSRNLASLARAVPEFPRARPVLGARGRGRALSVLGRSIVGDGNP